MVNTAVPTYNAEVIDLGAQAQLIADKIQGLVAVGHSDPDVRAKRARHLSIARTQIELGIAMLIVAADL